MRRMFGVAKDRIQFGYDYASLEARVNGHYVYIYTDGPQLAQSLVAEKPNDCFDTETMLLTNKGWITSDQITEDTLIANWSTTLLNYITYSKPTNIIRKKYAGKMIRVLGDRLDMKVTPNHRVMVYNRGINKYDVVLAKDLKQYVKANPESFIPASGVSTIDEASTYAYDPSKLINISDTSSGTIVQSYDKETITNIATKQRLLGSCSLILEKEGTEGTIYQTLIGKSPLNQDGFKLIDEEIFTEEVYEDVWCVSIPSTYVIVKRNNSIYVSGNCHTLNSKRLGISRTDAKSFGYAVMYGATSAKLAKMLKVSEQEGKRLYNLYWEGVPALKELKDKVEKFWVSTGKKYILSIDKRKLFVRSKHSLINLLFQSAGSLIMKYGNLETANRLDAMGLLGDPFFDSRDAVKIFPMIIYHKLIVAL